MPVLKPHWFLRASPTRSTKNDLFESLSFWAYLLESQGSGYPPQKLAPVPKWPWCRFSILCIKRKPGMCEHVKNATFYKIVCWTKNLCTIWGKNNPTFLQLLLLWWAQLLLQMRSTRTLRYIFNNNKKKDAKILQEQSLGTFGKIKAAVKISK